MIGMELLASFKKRQLSIGNCCLLWLIIGFVDQTETGCWICWLLVVVAIIELNKTSEMDEGKSDQATWTRPPLSDGGPECWSNLYYMVDYMQCAVRGEVVVRGIPNNAVGCWVNITQQPICCYANIIIQMHTSHWHFSDGMNDIEDVAPHSNIIQASFFIVFH